MKLQLIPYHKIYSKAYPINETIECEEYWEEEYPHKVYETGPHSNYIEDENGFFSKFTLAVFQYDDENKKTFLGNVRGYQINGELVHNAFLSEREDTVFFAFDSVSELMWQLYPLIEGKYRRGNMDTVFITQYPEQAYGLELAVLQLACKSMRRETNEMYITYGCRELTDDDFIEVNEIMQRKHLNYLNSKMKPVSKNLYKKDFGRFQEVTW